MAIKKQFNKIHIAALAVLVLTILVYLPSLSNGWTNWDDHVYVLENYLVLGHNWSALLTTPISANYHPITMISLTMDHVIWGTEAFGYHLTNLVVHGICTVLVFYFIQNLQFRQTFWLPFFVALLFGIHPMHVESVAWISERKDVLYGSFFVAGLIVYLSYLKTSKFKYLAVTFVLFLCAVLSKAMAVVFPIILILLDWYLEKNPWSTKRLLEKIPFLLVSLIFGTDNGHAINKKDTDIR